MFRTRPPQEGLPETARRRGTPAGQTRDPHGDAELVALAKRDREEFAHLVRRYQAPVFRFCYSLLADRDAAADAAQTTFMKAWERLDSCRDGAAFESWLFRIAHNVVNDDYRSRRPFAAWEEAERVEDWRDSPESLVIDAERRQTLWSLYARLAPEERQLIALRLNGLNDKQIAEVLGRSHGTIRNKQSKAIGRLRDMLAAAIGKEARRDGR